MPKKQVEMLAKAISLASKHHDGQLYGDKPYILHPMRVMLSLSIHDLEIQQIAIMHDLVEDTEVSALDLLDYGFSTRVVNAIALLTHNPKESYEHYIEGISTSIDATIVKLADLADNSDLSRQKPGSPARLAKYREAMKYLNVTLARLYIEKTK